MCGNCKEGSCKSSCVGSVIAKVLVIVGGINWGLVGLGMLLGQTSDSFNVVRLLLGSMPVLEGIVYVLVGLSALMMIFTCKCNKCKDGACEVGEKKEEVKM